MCSARALWRDFLDRKRSYSNIAAVSARGLSRGVFASLAAGTRRPRLLCRRTAHNTHKYLSRLDLRSALCREFKALSHTNSCFHAGGACAPNDHAKAMHDDADGPNATRWSFALWDRWQLQTICW